MIIIEVLANKIADGLAGQLNLDHNKRSVIAYGLIGLIQVIALFIVVSFIGLLSNSLYESLIILFSVGFIRKSTGGAHSKTMSGCNTISILSITMLTLVSRYLLNSPIGTNLNFGITIAIFAIVYVVFYLRVPVDSPNKPIVVQEKINRLRKESYIKLFVLLALTLLAIVLADTNERFLSIASSIRVALIWQAVTLTEIGISIIDKLDNIVNSK